MLNNNKLKQFILTHRGEISINEIKIGDQVLGFDGKEYIYEQVDQVGIFGYRNRAIAINEKYIFSQNQSIYANGQVTHAKLLKIGDKLKTIKGGTIIIKKIERIKAKGRKFTLLSIGKKGFIEKIWNKIIGKKSHHNYFINGILVHNASRYWVGGGSSVNWNATGNTNWGSASNTQDNASVPSSGDDVYFDGVGTGASNSTLSASITVRSVNFTGYVNILTHDAAITLSIGDATAGAGNVALLMVSGMTYTKGSTTTSAISFISTSATVQTITLGAKVLGNTTFDGVAGSWQFADAFNASAATITLTKGTLDTNGQTVTCGAFSISGSSTRVLTLGASIINCTSWAASTITNLTLNENTSSIRVTGLGTFSGGGETYYEVQLNSQFHTVSGANTFTTLKRTGTATQTDSMSISATQTISGILTLNGNSLTNRLIVRSNILGTARTFIAAAVSISNCDFQDIIGAGVASPFIGTSLGNALGNSGITFTTAVTRYWVGGTGSWSQTTEWSATSGGAGSAGVPLCHDTVIFDANSFTAGSLEVEANMPRLGADINFTGVLNIPNFWLTTPSSVFGALTLVSGMTTSNSAATLIFEARSSVIFTTGGITIGCPVNITAFGGTIVLSGNLVLLSSRTLTLTNGTLDAGTNNVNVTTGLFSSSNFNTRTITMGSGTWELNGTDTVWSTFFSSGLTLNSDTSTIKITNTSATARTFSGGGKTYNNFWSSAGAGTASLTIAGSNTFADFKDDGTAAHSILFTAGTTQTVVTFTVRGSFGNVITINSTTTGTHALVKAGDGVIISDFLNIQHSVATPANTWYAGLNSTDNQGVATAGSGWSFTVATLTQTFIVDGIILRQYDKTFIIDGIIFGINIVSFIVDGIIFGTNNKTFIIDGIVKEINSSTFTVDGIIKAITLNTFTVDGIIFGQTYHNFTIDALIIDLRTYKTFITDGIIIFTTLISFTIDGLIVFKSIFGMFFGLRLSGVQLLPKTLTREFIFQKTDFTAITGKLSRDQSNRKEKFMIGLENLTKSTIDQLMGIIALNHSVLFTINAKDLIIISEMCFPYIASISYNMSGGEYRASIQLELIVEE